MERSSRFRDCLRERPHYFSYSGKGPGGTATHLATARLAGDALQDVSTIFAATPYTADHTSVEPLMADRPVRIRNVKQGPNGALYILTDEADGRIIRLDRAR